MERKTQDQRSAETMARVLEVAERHFATHGYDATSTESLVADAGLTRGALYHHFGSKRGLFEAVVGAVQERLAQVVADQTRMDDPWEALRVGSRAWLGAATDSAVQRILLLDAPSVLGWERWLALDEGGGGRLLQEGVAAEMGEGSLEPPLSLDSAALAQLLNGALNGLALWVAAAEDREAALVAANKALERVLQGLRKS